MYKCLCLLLIRLSLVRAQQGEPRKKQVERLAFFYPIRRIGMESRRSRVCNRRQAHGITRLRLFPLRIDYIQHFVLIPYRRLAADFIHGFAVILRAAFLCYERKTKTESKRTPFLFCFSLGLRFSDTLAQLVALQGRIFPQGSSRRACEPCHMVQVR